VNMSAAAGGDGERINSSSCGGGDLDREHISGGRAEGQRGRGWSHRDGGGALAVSVTVPLKPLMAESARELTPDPEGEICTSALCVVREKSD